MTNTYTTVPHWIKNVFFFPSLVLSNMVALVDRRKWGCAEHRLVCHPCLKWTDTINSRDSGDLLTVQDKVSARAQSSTWPAGPGPNLAPVAYSMWCVPQSQQWGRWGWGLRVRGGICGSGGLFCWGSIQCFFFLSTVELVKSPRKYYTFIL